MKKLIFKAAVAALVVASSATPAAANWNWNPAVDFCRQTQKPVAWFPMGFFRLPCVSPMSS